MDSPDVAWRRAVAVTTSESLLADLKRLPLLTPEQLARVESAARTGTHPPDRVLNRLVEKGWLTAFQGEAILQGRGATLVFGPYVLLDAIGEGGMGRVYQARHRRLGRVDALKVIRADKIASKVIAKRFLREIRLTSTLEHPNIVRAMDAGEVGTQLYLATEFVRGEDFGTIVRRDGPLSIADACLVVYQTALALQHVHDRGLVHRDLKPTNLMRETATRTVKLLDLGLSGVYEPANQESLAGQLTGDGVILGTPDFMAPEQAHDPHGVDIRADLYGLGCTFYFLLTGRPPYSGSTVDKLMAHAASPVPPVVLPAGPTPPALATIVARLMAKRPEDRYQTPHDLTVALMALRPGPHADPSAADPLVESRPPVDEWQSEFDQLVALDGSSSHHAALSPSPAAGGPSGGRRWGGPVVGLLVAAVILAVTIQLSRRTSPPPDPPPNPVVEESPAEELRALVKGERNPAEDRDTLRKRVVEFRARHPGSSLGASAAGVLRRLPSPLDRLSFAPEADAGPPVVRLAGTGPPAVWLGFTPTDGRLFVARRRGVLEEWLLPAATETGRFRALADGDDRETAVVAPDGRVAVGVTDGALVVLTDATGRVRTVGVVTPVRLAAVAPDGKTVVAVFADPDERLGRVDLDSGRITGTLDSPSGKVAALAVSPDGRTCLLAGGEVLRVVEIASGKETGTFTEMKGAGVPGGIFGPNGQRVYLIGVGVGVGRYVPGNTLPEVRYELPDEVLPPSAFNPWRPRPRHARPTCVAAAADEGAVAIGTRAGGVHVFAAATGKATQEYLFATPVRALAFSTHGRVLAVALDDGSVLLVPLRP